jgi:hypothetical protein
MHTPIYFREQPFVSDKSPFNLRPVERRFRMVLDHAHIHNDEMLNMLNGFSDHNSLWIVSTDSEHQHPIIIEKEEPDRVLGSVQVGDTNYGAGFPFAEQWRHFGIHPVLKDEFVMPDGPWQDSTYRYQQYALVKIAESLNADVLVTDDPFLLDFQRPGFLKQNLLCSVDAVELMGSYLRSHGDFTIEMVPGYRRDIGRFFFYIVWARDLLPHGWRWFTACVESDRANNTDLINLGGSALTRVQQALKARDFVHWQLFRSGGNAGADDVLFYLDMMLVSLAASFDVLARVADIALGLGTDRYLISWRKAKWRKALNRAAPELGNCMAAASENGRVHALLSLLRNSVHGEALASLHSKQDDKLHQLLIIPEHDRREIEQLLDRLGGRDAWGYHGITDLYRCLAPGRLVEMLLPKAIRALDDIMANTPVERLPGVAPNLDARCASPEMDFWHPRVRHAIRVLGGI